MGSAQFRQRLEFVLTRIFAAALFLAFLSWGWRVRDLFHALPAYGDVLETLWGLTWYSDAWLNGKDASFFAGIFHPVGWQVATFAQSPALFLLLVPLSALGGTAFAYNTAIIGAFGLAFVGMFLLARRMNLSFVLAAVAATLFTFCGVHWFKIGGHLNQLLGSATLPWLLWSIEHAWGDKRFVPRGFIAAGLLWGSAAAISFYFIFFGGIAAYSWVFGKWITRRQRGPAAIRGLLIMSLIAAALCAPLLWSHARALEAAGVPPSDIAWTSAWGASINSFPTPSAGHPIAQLRGLHRWLYRGPDDESGTINLGLAASLLALAGLWRARKERAWWPVFVTVALGIVFALGYTLRWNGEAVEWSGFRGVDKAIWMIGHRLKPDFFRPVEPYGPLIQGWPLPSLVFAAIVPYWEGARTLSRFAFIALPGFFLMVGRGLQATRPRFLQIGLIALLLVEVLPPPTGSVPVSPRTHPAFDWLRTETRPQDGLIDLYSPRPDILEPVFGGEILLATSYHQRSTASGAGWGWPAHTWFLRDWLLQHPKAFQDPEFTPILRYFNISYIVLHMRSPRERAALQMAQQDVQLQMERCFEPPAGPTPWQYPMCIIRVLPPIHPAFNVILGDGWSGQEQGEVWAQGVESTGRWVATAERGYQLLIEASPMCAPSQIQTIAISVNGTPISTYEGKTCAPWVQAIQVPAELVKVGWNDLALRYAYAVEPGGTTEGSNEDDPSSSVRFTRLQIIQYEKN